MKYSCTLLATKDIDKSVEFYKKVFGLRVIQDFGANKTLTGNIALQTLETWQEFIQTKDVNFFNNATEIYFEEEKFDEFIQNLQKIEDIKYVHKVKEHEWGQRAVRIYDLDGHIIEVGETLSAVAKRFACKNMNAQDIAKRMGISQSLAERLLKK